MWGGPYCDTLRDDKVGETLLIDSSAEEQEYTVHRGGPLWQLLRHNISEARLDQLRRRISLRTGEPTVGVVPLLAIRTILTNRHNTLCWSAEGCSCWVGYLRAH